MKQTSTWADEVLSRIQESGRRIHCLERKMKAYDSLNWWRRMRMGGLVYRVFLEYCYLAEMDDYTTADMQIKD